MDALPPSVLREMVRDVIANHISNTDLLVLRAAEDSERRALEMFARKSGSM